MKFTGYFDINGMTPHQAVSHLTEEQQENYKAQICAWLQTQLFVVDRFHIDLQLVSDNIIVMEQVPPSDNPLARSFPAAPQMEPVTVPRHRLQYTVDLEALPMPPSSGLILPGQENGQMSQIMLRPLPEADTP